MFLRTGAETMVDIGNVQAIIARSSAKPLLAVLSVQVRRCCGRQGISRPMGAASGRRNGAGRRRAGLPLHVQLERHRGADVKSSRPRRGARSPCVWRILYRRNPGAGWWHCAATRLPGSEFSGLLVERQVCIARYRPRHPYRLQHSRTEDRLPRRSTPVCGRLLVCGNLLLKVGTTEPFPDSVRRTAGCILATATGLPTPTSTGSTQRQPAQRIFAKSSSAIPTKTTPPRRIVLASGRILRAMAPLSAFPGSTRTSPVSTSFSETTHRKQPSTWRPRSRKNGSPRS